MCFLWFLWRNLATRTAHLCTCAVQLGEYLYVFINIYNIYICMYMYVNVYVCMYIYIYIHTYVAAGNYILQ